MKVLNLEPGLLKLMTTVFRSRGLNPTAADAKAKQQLTAATKVFQAACRKCMTDKMRHGGGAEDAISRGRRAVVAWAHRQ